VSMLTEHLREFEGCKLTAYKCPAGVWTIGYGHTGQDVHEGLTITQDRADELLSQDLAWVRRCIEKTVHVPLDAGQEAAVSSLIFNIGATNWRKSTALKRLNNGNYLGAADAMTWFRKAGGKVMPGLVRRREAERQMFLSGMEAGPAEDMPQKVEGGEAKPTVKSKEIAASITGVIGTVGAMWGQAQDQLAPLIAWGREYAMWILLALFVFFLANRLWAMKRGDR